MAKNIVIVESPAKSKTISKFLGKDYEVTASMGHLVDLPQTRMGVDVKNNFTPEYVVISKRKKNFAELKKEIAGKDTVYLAADPDREGEAISWHIATRLCKGKKVYRVTFNEITKEAIVEAFKRPHSLNENLINAQQARRIMDRIVGYSLSPLLWQKVSKGLSAGRVQSVATRLVVERERDIQNFVPQEYWEIEAELIKQKATKPIEERSFLAKLEKIEGKKPEIPTKERAEKIVESLKKETYVVQDINVTTKKKNAPAPFTTSKLQQEGFNKLRFPVGKTMKIAQDLYEGVELSKKEAVGLITYMRTDSVRVAESAQAAARKYILKKFGDEYYPEKPNVYKSKKTAQEAHEAIRPALPLREPKSVEKYLAPDHFKLYELIWNRFIASQMVPAVYEVTSVQIAAGRCLFKATGSRILFDGFEGIYYENEDEEEKRQERLLPPLTLKEILKLLKLTPTQHFTKPPPRYSDASLVKALEEKGIGRPSTYAPIIQTIIMRHYTRREKGYLFPTELGTLVTGLLIEHFPKILDVQFTATMEDELDEIEEGRMNWVSVLRDFYGPFKISLDEAAKRMRAVKKEVIRTKERCDQCGRPMVIKWSRRGKFLSCSGFPACKNAKPISTGVKCPSGCGGELVERRSRRGLFYGCINFPRCRFTASTLPETKQEDNNSNTNTAGNPAGNEA